MAPDADTRFAGATPISTDRRNTSNSCQDFVDTLCSALRFRAGSTTIKPVRKNLTRESRTCNYTHLSDTCSEQLVRNGVVSPLLAFPGLLMLAGCSSPDDNRDIAQRFPPLCLFR